MNTLNYYDRIRLWRANRLMNSVHHDGWTAHYIFAGKATGSIRSLSVRDLGGFNLSFFHSPLISKQSNVGRKFVVADGR